MLQCTTESYYMLRISWVVIDPVLAGLVLVLGFAFGSQFAAFIQWDFG